MQFLIRTLAFGMVTLAATPCRATLHAQNQPEPSRAAGLTLRQAVEIALRQNPQAEIALQQAKLASARLDEADAGRLPRLAFSETYTHGNNPVYVFGSLLEQNRFGLQNFQLDALNDPGAISNFRSSLQLQIPLFNRFAVDSQIQKARLGVDRATAMDEEARQQIRFRAIQAYFGVVLAEARQGVAAESVKSAEAEAERIGSLVDQGQAVESDRLAMQVQVADFRQQLIRAEGEVRTAYARLNATMADDLNRQPVLKGDLTQLSVALPPLEELVAASLQQRPEITQLRLQLEAAQQDVRAGEGQYWPDLNVFAEVGHSSHTLLNGSGDFAVGARVTFNILDFGREGRIDQARFGMEQIRAQLRGLESQARLEVVESYHRFQAADESLRVADLAVTQAAEALRIIQDRQAVGLTTVTEVLRAQTALLQAEFNRLASRFQHRIAYAQVLLASGQLSDVTAFEG